MTDNGSYGSPEGVQSTVATVPKSVADGLAEALGEYLIAAVLPSGARKNSLLAGASLRARNLLAEYRKATQ